jgi:hypothetical protein
MSSYIPPSIVDSNIAHAVSHKATERGAATVWDFIDSVNTAVSECGHLLDRFARMSPPPVQARQRDVFPLPLPGAIDEDSREQVSISRLACGVVRGLSRLYGVGESCHGCRPTAPQQCILLRITLKCKRFVERL